MEGLYAYQIKVELLLWFFFIGEVLISADRL